MSLKEKITEDMKTAMRAKDTSRLEVIRMLRAAIQRREVDDRIELDEQGVLAVIQKMIKQGQDSISQFNAGNRPDLADKEQLGIDILKTYLPEPISDAEIDDLVSSAIEQTGAASLRDMGKVMGILKSQIAGRADMGSVSKRIKERLGG
ncbi:GatB/YqeY domain-containing protein [Pseudomonadota bacterium]